MSIKREISSNYGIFSEKFIIPSGYNLNNSNRTLLPQPQGLLAYDPGQNTVFHSNGNEWIPIQGSLGPTGPAGPEETNIPDILINQTLFVDPVHNTTPSERENLQKPYDNIITAIADAQSGDLIVVRPGEYTLTDAIILPENKDINFYFEPGSVVTNSSGRVFLSNPGENETRNHNILGYGEFYSNLGVLALFGAGITKMRFEANVASMISEGTGLIILIDSPNSELNVLVRKEIRQNSAFECIRIDNSPGSVLNLTATNLIQEGVGPIFIQFGGNTDTISHINFDKATSKRLGFSNLSGIAHINGNSIEILNEQDEPVDLRCITAQDTAETYVNVNSIIMKSDNKPSDSVFIVADNNSTLHLRSKFCKSEYGIFVRNLSNENEEKNLFFDVDLVEFGKDGITLDHLLLISGQGTNNVKGRFGKVVYLGTGEFDLIHIGPFASSYNVNITVESNVDSGIVRILSNSNRLQSSFKLDIKNFFDLYIESDEPSIFDIKSIDILGDLEIKGSNNSVFNGDLNIICDSLCKNKNFTLNQGSGKISITTFDFGNLDFPILNFDITQIGDFSIKALNFVGNPQEKIFFNESLDGKLTNFEIDNFRAGSLDFRMTPGDPENPWIFVLKSKNVNFGDPDPILGTIDIVSNNSNIFDIECDTFRGNTVYIVEDFKGKFKFHVNKTALFNEVALPADFLGIDIGSTNPASDTIRPDIDIYIKYLSGTNIIVKPQAGRCKLEFDEISLSNILNIQGCKPINNSEEPSVIFKARVLDHMRNETTENISLFQKFSIGTDLSTRIRDNGSLLRDPVVIGIDGGVPGDTFPLGTHTSGSLIFDVDTLRTTQIIQICGSSHESQLDSNKSRDMVRVEILGKSWDLQNCRITTGAYQKAQVVYDVSVINSYHYDDPEDSEGLNAESFIYDTDPFPHFPVVEMLFGNSSDKGGTVVFKDTTVVNLNGSNPNFKVSETQDCMILWMQPSVTTIQKNSLWIIKGENGVTDAGNEGLKHLAMPVFTNKSFNVMAITLTEGFEHNSSDFEEAFWTS